MLLTHIMTQMAQGTTHVLILLDTTDTTGVNDGLIAIARLLASFVGGVLSIAFVVEGYNYMFSDSATRGMHLKRSLMCLLGGTILIVFAVALAPVVIGLFNPVVPK